MTGIIGDARLYVADASLSRKDIIYVDVSTMIVSPKSIADTLTTRSVN